MNRKKILLMLIVLLTILAFFSSSGFSQESLMQYTSRSFAIVEATIEGTVQHPLSKYGPVHSCTLINTKRGESMPGNFLIQGEFVGPEGPVWRLYLGQPMIIQIDLKHPISEPVYPIIYAAPVAPPNISMLSMSNLEASTSQSLASLQESYGDVLARATVPIERDPDVIAFSINACSESQNIQ